MFLLVPFNLIKYIKERIRGGIVRTAREVISDGSYRLSDTEVFVLNSRNKGKLHFRSLLMQVFADFLAM